MSARERAEAVAAVAGGIAHHAGGDLQGINLKLDLPLDDPAAVVDGLRAVADALDRNVLGVEPAPSWQEGGRLRELLENAIQERLVELGDRASYLERAIAAADVALDHTKPNTTPVDLVFDGPPSPDPCPDHDPEVRADCAACQTSPRFVETEDLGGRSVGIGQWVELDRGGPASASGRGYWALRVDVPLRDVRRNADG